MMQIELQKHIASLSSEEFEGFLSNINMIPLLTIDEEIELIRRIRKGGSEAEQAKEVLVKTNLRYIYSVAKVYENPYLSIQKLLVIGITGLIRAARKFDETRGFRFISYAVWWIIERMLNAILKRRKEDKSSETIVHLTNREL